MKSDIEPGICWRCVFSAAIPLALVGGFIWYVGDALEGRVSEDATSLASITQLEDRASIAERELIAARQAAEQARGPLDAAALAAAAARLSPPERATLDETLGLAGETQGPPMPPGTAREIMLDAADLRSPQREILFQSLPRIAGFQTWFGSLPVDEQQRWLDQMPINETIFGVEPISTPAPVPATPPDASAVREASAGLPPLLEAALARRFALAAQDAETAAPTTAAAALSGGAADDAQGADGAGADADADARVTRLQAELNAVRDAARADAAALAETRDALADAQAAAVALTRRAEEAAAAQTEAEAQLTALRSERAAAPPPSATTPSEAGPTNPFGAPAPSEPAAAANPFGQPTEAAPPRNPFGAADPQDVEPVRPNAKTPEADGPAQPEPVEASGPTLVRPVGMPPMSASAAAARLTELAAAAEEARQDARDAAERADQAESALMVADDALSAAEASAEAERAAAERARAEAQTAGQRAEREAAARTRAEETARGLESARDAALAAQRDAELRLASAAGGALGPALAGAPSESAFLARLRAQFAAGEVDLSAIGVCDAGAGEGRMLSSSLAFPSGSPVLSSEGRRALDEIASGIRSDLAANPDETWRLVVEGHTDKRPIARGPIPSNWELSALRAAAVVRYLAEQGLDEERMIVVARGPHDPIDPGENPEAFEMNRRIELHVTSEVR